MEKTILENLMAEITNANAGNDTLAKTLMDGKGPICSGIRTACQKLEVERAEMIQKLVTYEQTIINLQGTLEQQKKDKPAENNAN